MKDNLQKNCRSLLDAFKSGKLGQTVMPEDSNPGLTSMDTESRIAYFTLPMALNYQRDSYKLWEAALKTYNDPETRFVFDVSKVVQVSEEKLRSALMKYKVALQPNKHIHSWHTIAKAIHEHWGTFKEFFFASEHDFIKLKQLITVDYKKQFPYLSGPKIFNYWSFIMSTYGDVALSNRNHIGIAPDTHITQCSVKLGVISEEEAKTFSKDAIAEKWKELLEGSGIDPIDMHPPLWFWSRNGFLYTIE